MMKLITLIIGISFLVTACQEEEVYNAESLIGEDQTICANSVPNEIVSVSIKYDNEDSWFAWYYSYDQEEWEIILVDDDLYRGKSYQPEALTQTTYFKRCNGLYNNHPTDYSNIVTIEVTDCTE